MPFHEQHPGVFLDLGVGANDFSTMPTPLVGIDRKITPFQFKGDNRYIGVDAPTQPDRYWRGIHQWFLGGDSEIDENSRDDPEVISLKFKAVKHVVRSFRPDDNIDFIVADAEKLPFENGAVSEVYIANVIGSQMVDEHVAKILSEARRVIGNLGRLTIRENLTPHWVSADINKILQDAGFAREVDRYRIGTPEYAALVEQYGLHPNDQEAELPSDESLFMVTTVG